MDDKLVEDVARAIAGASASDDWVDEFWPNYVDDAEAAIRVCRAAVVEECAKVAEEVYPRGSAHTYASENTGVYVAQECASELIAAEIRALLNEGRA